MYVYTFLCTSSTCLYYTHSYVFVGQVEKFIAVLERFLKNTHYSLNSLPFLLFNTQNYHTSFRHDFLMEGKTKTQKKITMTSSLPCTFDI